MHVECFSLAALKESVGHIPISNAGTAPLIIQTISSSLPGLELSPATLTIAPGATARIAVKWLAVTATEPGKPHAATRTSASRCPGSGTEHTFEADLGLASNDLDRPFAAIAVQLTVCGRPPE